MARCGLLMFESGFFRNEVLMTTWVNFKELGQKLDFEEVLQFYGVKIRRRGNQHVGFCPLPDHHGKKRSPSFSANLERGVFHCFGCGAKGNILGFAALMEKADPKNGKELHEIAVKLQERFCPSQSGSSKPKSDTPPAKANEPARSGETPVVVNAPLGFELKGIDRTHPYLRSRGFSQATIDRFGLGYVSRGSLKGRIAIPLHDAEGILVGYGSRVVDDKTIGEWNPRYRFPSKRVRDGLIHEFRKSAFLYNGFRVRAPVDDLIVVEGFASVWWLDQSGLPNAVAIMGSDCSEKQTELVVALVKPSGRVWVMPDGDEAGQRCAASLLLKLSPQRSVRWAKLPHDKQPTDLSAAELNRLLRGEA